MKTILILAIWMAGMFCAPAARNSTPAPSNVGNAEYPRIAPDRRVTFRLKAPKAQQVQLHGGAGLVNDALDLVRGDDGVWTVTTNERGWIEQGRANFILDNLIAAGRANPMILVVDTGYASFAGVDVTTNRSARTAAFEEVMLKELIPLINATYRTLSDRMHRAMAGLSMGSGQTLNLTLRHLDQFAWIGAMSGPPRQGFEVKTAYGGAFSDTAAFNQKVKLLWLGAGTAETQFHQSTLAMHEALDRAGINNVFYSSPGTDHEWQTWRRSLQDLAPRLFRE